MIKVLEPAMVGIICRRDRVLHRVFDVEPIESFAISDFGVAPRDSSWASNLANCWSRSLGSIAGVVLALLFLPVHKF